MKNKALELLKRLHSDMIDGIQSGANSEDEKAEVFEAIEEIEAIDKDFEYKNIHCDNLISMHKQEIISILNRCCKDCIYSNKINNYTFICNNKFSPTDDLIVDSSFSCKLWRNQ